MDKPDDRQEPVQPEKPSPADVAARLATGQLIKELSVGMGMPYGPPEDPAAN